MMEANDPAPEITLPDRGTIPAGLGTMPAQFHGRNLQRSLRFLVTAGVFFVTWRSVRIDQVNVTASDLAFFASAILLANRGSFNSAPFGPLNALWIFGFVSMLAGLLLGTLINGEPLRWITGSLQYAFSFLLIPIVLFSVSRRYNHKLILYFVAGVATSQAIGLAGNFLFPKNEIWDLLGLRLVTGSGRLGALAGDPNPNGAACAFALAFLIYALRRKIISWRLGAVYGVLVCAGLLSTASFTAFIAATIAVFVFLVTSDLRFAVRTAATVLLLGTVYFVLGGELPAIFEQRVGEAIGNLQIQKAGTFAGRLALMKEAWSLVDGHILIGLGFDQYREISAYGAPVHNVHLLILTEGGIVAYAGLLAMFLVLILSAFRIFRTDRLDGAFALSVIGVFFTVSFSAPHIYGREWFAPVVVALACIWPRFPRMRQFARTPTGAGDMTPETPRP